MHVSGEYVVDLDGPDEALPPPASVSLVVNENCYYYPLGCTLSCLEDERFEFKAHSRLTWPAITGDASVESAPHRADLPKGVLNPSYTGKKPISRSLCALANSPSGGVVLCGVLDDGRVAGLPFSADEQDHMLVDLAALLARYRPPLGPDRYRVNFVPVLTPGEVDEYIGCRAVNEEVFGSLAGSDSSSDELQASGSSSGEVPANGSSSSKLPANGSLSNEVPANGSSSGKLLANGSSSDKLPANRSSSNEVPAHGSSFSKLPANGSSSDKPPANDSSCDSFAACGHFADFLLANESSCDSLPTDDNSADPLLVDCSGALIDKAKPVEFLLAGGSSSSSASPDQTPSSSASGDVPLVGKPMDAFSANVNSTGSLPAKLKSTHSLPANGNSAGSLPTSEASTASTPTNGNSPHGAANGASTHSLPTNGSSTGSQPANEDAADGSLPANGDAAGSLPANGVELPGSGVRAHQLEPSRRCWCYTERLANHREGTATRRYVLRIEMLPQLYQQVDISSGSCDIALPDDWAEDDAEDDEFLAAEPLSVRVPVFVRDEEGRHRVRSLGASRCVALWQLQQLSAARTQDALEADVRHLRREVAELRRLRDSLAVGSDGSEAFDTVGADS